MFMQQDMLHNEINAGDLIAYATARGGMQFGIVREVTTNKIKIIVPEYKRKWTGVTYEDLGWGSRKATLTNACIVVIPFESLRKDRYRAGEIEQFYKIKQEVLHGS